MRKMQGVDPTTLLPANTTVPVVGTGQHFDSGLVTSCGALYFKNKSNVGVNIVFDNGMSAEIPAWHARLFSMKQRVNQLWLSQAYQLPIATSPISQLDYEVYQAGEDTSGLYTGPINYRTTIGNHLGLGQTFDALLTAFPSLDITINTPQVFGLGAGFLNLAGVSASTPGYLVLGYFNSDMGRQTFLDTRGNKEMAWQLFNITIPNGGGAQTFLFAPANWCKSLAIYGFTAGVSINGLQIKRSQDAVGAYTQVLGGGTTANKLFDLGIFWGPDGMPNQVSQGSTRGFDILANFGNTSGAPQALTMECYGAVVAYDEAVVIVVYEDWQGNNYTLGTTKIGQLTNWPIDFLVPIPITDPTQTNFGSISLTVISSHVFYNTHYKLDITVPCIVSFLAPE